jgi:hypothetical protein
VRIKARWTLKAKETSQHDRLREDDSRPLWRIDGLKWDVATKLAKCLLDASSEMAVINGPLSTQAACYRVPE